MIILISDQRVLGIPVEDNGEKLVDLRKVPELALSKKRCVQNPDYFMLRETVVALLIKAQKTLPSDIRFLIEEGYRPLGVQKKIFDDYCLEIKKKYPEWRQEKVFREAQKYVALPTGIPPHSTGGAVDLTLITSAFHELEMGSTSDDKPIHNPNVGYMEASNISEEATANRTLLRLALENIGFVNYPMEWWHWSYGEKYWAFVQKKSKAIYDIIYLDK